MIICCQDIVSMNFLKNNTFFFHFLFGQTQIASPDCAASNLVEIRIPKKFSVCSSESKLNEITLPEAADPQHNTILVATGMIFLSCGTVALYGPFYYFVFADPQKINK